MNDNFTFSAVVSIEKQFQIPSRMSGLMVSAGDFGYIPSVVFVSYLGGKVTIERNYVFIDASITVNRMLNSNKTHSARYLVGVYLKHQHTALFH